MKRLYNETTEQLNSTGKHIEEKVYRLLEDMIITEYKEGWSTRDLQSIICDATMDIVLNCRLGLYGD